MSLMNAGLISQVAEDLWEVKDKKVINLTKQDVSIVDYKKQLAKRSEYVSPQSCYKMLTSPGQAQIEKAKLISKTAQKGVA